MIKNKGASRSMTEKIFLAIKVVIAVIVLVVIGMRFAGAETGCERHDDYPYACIRDSDCLPYIDYAGGNFGEDVVCTDAVRTPNNRFNAAEDPECRCPDGWMEVADEESEYYGICQDGYGNHMPCFYGEPDYPLPGEVDNCDGRKHGELWSERGDLGVYSYCCDDGETKYREDDDLEEGDICVVHKLVDVSEWEGSTYYSGHGWDPGH